MAKNIVEDIPSWKTLAPSICMYYDNQSANGMAQSVISMVSLDIYIDDIIH